MASTMARASADDAGLWRARLNRRAFAQLSAAALGGALAGCGTGARTGNTRTIRIGYISPQSGPFAAFGEADPHVLDGIRAELRGGLKLGGRSYPVEIVAKDSQSDPGRARTVTEDLLKREHIDLMLASSTPETTNAPADVSERLGVPFLSTGGPWQSHFFGRKGNPSRPFRWTYHFYWGLEDVIGVFTDMWSALSTNRVVGALWPNDVDGIAWSDPQKGFPPGLLQKGYQIVDPGRYRGDGNNYSSVIEKLRDGNAQIVTGVPTPPDFATIWKQAGDLGYKPQAASMGRALLFPAFIEAIGPTAEGLTIGAGWTPTFPFKSTLSGATAAQLADDYTKQTDLQWIQPIGFVHALFEVAVDVLKRAGSLDPSAIAQAIPATQLRTIVGQVSWHNGPVPNVAKTPLVGGQWRRGKQFPFELAIVSNRAHPDISLTARVEAVT